MNETLKDCLCHISLRTSSRANKYTAAEAYSYINRLGRHATKKDMAYAKSFNIPIWAKPLPSSFWDLATKNESYYGRQAVNLNIALPRELSVRDNIALIEEYITIITSTPEGKLFCSYALHIDNEKEMANPHFHLMIYERPVPLNDIVPNPEMFFKKANRHYPERGGTKKVIYFSSVKAPKKLRLIWAKTANKYLQAINSNKRMNARSYKDRGIHKIPQEHLGVKSSYLLKHGVDTDRSKKNAEISLQNREYMNTNIIHEALHVMQECMEEYMKENIQTQTTYLMLGNTKNKTAYTPLNNTENIILCSTQENTENQNPYLTFENTEKNLHKKTQKNRELNLQSKYAEAQTSTQIKQEIHFSEMQNITQNIQQNNSLKIQTSTQRNQYNDFSKIQTTTPTRIQNNFVKKQKSFMIYHHYYQNLNFY